MLFRGLSLKPSATTAIHAIVENNHGYLLLTLKRLDEAEAHLARARKLFDAFDDKVRRAQVDETLAQLHLAA